MIDRIDIDSRVTGNYCGRDFVGTVTRVDCGSIEIDLDEPIDLGHAIRTSIAVTGENRESLHWGPCAAAGCPETAVPGFRTCRWESCEQEAGE